MMRMGIRRKKAGAGLLLGPSHQMERPIVRLEIVTARTEASTPIHVRNDTMRHPSLG